MVRFPGRPRLLSPKAATGAGKIEQLASYATSQQSFAGRLISSLMQELMKTMSFLP
jgi:hypothetical protein